MSVLIYQVKGTQKYRIRKEGEEPYPEEFLTLENAKLVARLVYPSIPRLVLR
jgi:hypothetical protein